MDFSHKEWILAIIYHNKSVKAKKMYLFSVRTSNDMFKEINFFFKLKFYSKGFL